MKVNIALYLLAGLTIFYACDPNRKQIELQEKVILDSMRISDSVAALRKIEVLKQDSISVLVARRERLKHDSISNIEARKEMLRRDSIARMEEMEVEKARLDAADHIGEIKTSNKK
jgi:hypothetical protein